LRLAARVSAHGRHWTALLEQCAHGLTDPSSLVEGLHVLTFNQIVATEARRTEQLERLRR
jgi:methylenetetrahydrofolate reductase (NADH)